MYTWAHFVNNNIMAQRYFELNHRLRRYSSIKSPLDQRLLMSGEAIFFRYVGQISLALMTLN